MNPPSPDSVSPLAPMVDPSALTANASRIVMTPARRGSALVPVEAVQGRDFTCQSRLRSDPQTKSLVLALRGDRKLIESHVMGKRDKRNAHRV